MFKFIGSLINLTHKIFAKIFKLTNKKKNFLDDYEQFNYFDYFDEEK